MREISLDILRGIFIFDMIFVDSPVDFSQSYKIFLHTAWEGISIADLAFPGFVFTMGMASAYSTAKKSPTLQKIFRRTIILFLLGILYNELPAIFSLFLSADYTKEIFYTQAIEHIRIFGVLQRLALAYFLGLLIVKFLKSEKKIIFASLILLIISSAGFHIYSPENPFDRADNISLAVDLIFPGVNHIYVDYDPEGLYGTIATTSSMLFGFIVGKILMRGEIFLLLKFGVGFLIFGVLWNFLDITSKPLWTAPYVFFNASFDTFLLVTIKFLCENFFVAEKIFHPIMALGMNPIIFYFLNLFGLCFLFLIKVGDISIYKFIFEHSIKGFISMPFSIALYSFVYCSLWFPLAEIFYRKKIFIKL